MGLTDLIPGVSEGKMIAFLGGVALTFGAGIAAGETYEHRVPWGLGPKYHHLQDSLPGRDSRMAQAGALKQFQMDLAVVGKYQARIRELESDAHDRSVQGGQTLDQMRATAAQQATSAYRLGRATCAGKGNTNATTPANGSTAAPVGLQPGDTDLLEFIGSAATTRAAQDSLSAGGKATRH